MKLFFLFVENKFSTLKIPNSFGRLVFFFLFFILFIQPVFAISIGISPHQITFNKENSERQITLFNTNKNPIVYELRILNYGNYFTFPKNGEIPAHSSTSFILKAVKIEDIETRILAKFTDPSSTNPTIYPLASTIITIEKEMNDELEVNKKTVTEPFQQQKKNIIKTSLTIMTIIIVLGIFIYVMIT